MDIQLVITLAFVFSSGSALVLYFYDRKKHNPDIPSMMHLVWTLTLIYSGLLGFAIYWFTGRKQITNDSLYRRSFRSTAHCYSGCGLGEILGVSIAVTFLNAVPFWIAFNSFLLAYVFGFSLTIGPLVQEGVAIKTAIFDALSTETVSITVMETVAILTDLYIIGGRPTTLLEPLFWIALFTSLSVGFLAAYPVNAILIKFGVKEGMMNPQNY